ncbi:VOC family protein [Massilia aurea]|uniref:VOC family protein n=1 Tax=Massilia aurea TaxID=373040 RepID=UPI00346302B8
MSVQTTTHLNFQGQARAALAFYQSVFGGQLLQFTYQDAGRTANPLDLDLIVWGQVEAPNGFRIMAFDVASGAPWQQGENAFYVSLRGDTQEEITDLWGKLADGAAVVHDLAPSGWSPLYGMLKDRFGVVWVVDVMTA